MADEENESSRAIVWLGVVALLGVVLWWFLYAGGGPAATVSGTVTLDNEPIAQAEVVYVADEGEAGPTSAQTDDAGSYRLHGHTAAGLPTGRYKVTVRKMVSSKDGSVPQGEQLLHARASGLLRNALPKLYEDRGKTPLHVEIRSGANRIDLRLKKLP